MLAVSTPVAAGLSIAGIIAVTALAVWVLARWRESSNDDFDATQASLKEFEEMRLGGDLTEEEYRNIKGLLANERAPQRTSELDPQG
jgi:hypothetical protein